jgi:hypothetical protein
MFLQNTSISEFHDQFFQLLKGEIILLTSFVLDDQSDLIVPKLIKSSVVIVLVCSFRFEGDIEGYTLRNRQRRYVRTRDSY